MLRSVLTCALAAFTAVHAIATISVKGSKFFTSDGNQFYVKGIAYQLVPDDPLVDTEQCQLDASLMKSIGANSIRVYHVDPYADHTGCMAAFADAGVYLWVDLDTFNTTIVQTEPKWTSVQYDAFAEVLDEFQQFDNVAGFFIGNEVINTAAGSSAAPYIKAAVRDMRAYRESKKYRNIPIGYSAADIASLRPMLQDYFACGDPSDALEFFSLNAYSWCGTSSYTQSGYDQLKANSTELQIPIFMSETGCNTVRPRDFADQNALFGDMADTWSGSIVYEWIEEANNYGLISYGPKVDPASPNAPPDGFPRSGTPTPVQPDFSNLSNVWKTLNPTGVKESAYSPTLSPPKCPESTSVAWEVEPSAALPLLGQAAATLGGASALKSAITSTGTGSQALASTTGTGSQIAASASATGGAARSSLSREMKGTSAALACVMAIFGWV